MSRSLYKFILSSIGEADKREFNSFLFFRQSGATVAKTRVFCYNHVIRQGADSYRPSDTMELNSAEIVRERKDIYENSCNI